MTSKVLIEIFGRHKIDSNNEDWDANDLDKIIDHDAIIHWVARYGMPEDLKILIDSGASIELKGDIGRTPLLEAIAFEQEECVKVLIKAGANVAASDDYGDFAIDLIPKGIKS